MTEHADAFRLPVRVYIEDTDAGGIVYYVNYLKFMERARTEWLRTLGSRHYTLAEGNWLFVVRDASVRYLRPARIDDLLHVTARPVRLGRASIDFRQSVYRGEELVCEAEVRVGCIRGDTFAPVAMPATLHQKIRQEMPA